MSLEYLADPSGEPRWKGLLPGRPEPYFLKRGEGEHAVLFADLFTVLLSGDETEGQFGVFTSQAPEGQLIPAHTHHGTGGFERFFQHIGQPADHGTTGQPPFIPDFPRMQAAAERYSMDFLPGFDWPDL
jgi:quercetin 2,3-dioxygenase